MKKLAKKTKLPNNTPTPSHRKSIRVSPVAPQRHEPKAQPNRVDAAGDFVLTPSETRYAKIWESTTDAIALTDPQGIVLDVNPAYCRLYGLERNEIVGNSLTLVFPAERQHLALAEYKTLFESAALPPLVETLLLRKDGSTHILESQYDFIVAHNERTAILSVTRDITARKQAAEELRRQLRELTSLNAIANVIIQLPDIQQLLVASLDIALNLADLHIGSIHLFGEDDSNLQLVAERGLSPQQLEDTREVHTQKAANVKERLLGDTILEGTASDLGLDFLSAQPYNFVAIPIKTKSRLLGVLTLIGAGAHPVNDTAKSLLATIGYQLGVAIENIRLVEKSAEVKALRELDRLRSELIANVSHELRTPLGLIKVFCTTLMAKDVAFDRLIRLEFLEDIDRETDKLERIVSNLLDLSRLQNNRLRLDKHALDLGELVTTVIEDLKLNLSQHPIVCELSVAPLPAIADPQRIEQVLRNLIGNAVKYSPEAGTITVQCRKEARQIVVSVTDEGIGIPTEELERIFERFHRVDNEITQRVGGVGLGLAVSRGIIEEHGGRIWAESVLGAGSTFYFTLPEVEPSEARAD